MPIRKGTRFMGVPIWDGLKAVPAFADYNERKSIAHGTMATAR
jgi:hypothetical protein